MTRRLFVWIAVRLVLWIVLAVPAASCSTTAPPPAVQVTPKQIVLPVDLFVGVNPKRFNYVRYEPEDTDAIQRAVDAAAAIQQIWPSVFVEVDLGTAKTYRLLEAIKLRHMRINMQISGNTFVLPRNGDSMFDLRASYLGLAGTELTLTQSVSGDGPYTGHIFESSAQGPADQR